MIINIQATLTVEQINILSTQKWYSENIPVSIWVEEKNPQSREDFIMQVYRSMIENDATNVFLAYSKEQRAELERIEEEKIRTSVSNSITSSVWS